MEFALSGILIGLALAAPIGPINIEIVRRGLKSGFLSGWLVGAGAVTGDTFYCLLVIAGIAPLVDRDIVKTVLWIAGSGFLSFLAYSSLRAALTRRDLLDSKVKSMERSSYLTGLLMALFNPLGLAFWLTIGGALVAAGVENSDDVGTAALVVGVIVGLCIWVTSLSMLVRGGRHFVSERVFRYVNIVSSVLMFGFAVWFAVQAVGSLA